MTGHMFTEWITATYILHQNTNNLVVSYCTQSRCKIMTNLFHIKLNVVF